MFRELSTQIWEFRDRAGEVRLTVVEDRPLTNEAPAFVDDFEYGVEDVLGWTEEVVRAAAEAEHNVSYPVNLDLARRSLARCQEEFARVEKRFASGLASYERLDQLNKLGQERRGEWLAWTNAVNRGLNHCRESIEKVRDSLVTCMGDIAERAGTTTISVQTTNIGQQVSSRTKGQAAGPAGLNATGTRGGSDA